MSHPEPNNIHDSLLNCVAFCSRDWSQNKRDAWIYGIVCGWEDAIEDVAQDHNWTPEAVKRLEMLHEQFEGLNTELAGSTKEKRHESG